MGNINRSARFVLLGIILLAFSNCENDEPAPVDRLEEVGVLGTWKLQTITLNGITDMSVQFGTIEFLADENSTDLKGEFRSNRYGSEESGRFELETSSDSIRFTRSNNKQIAFHYTISDKSLTFTYSEQGTTIEEDWKKEN